MNKILLLTGLLLTGISISAQQPDGTFKNGNDSIVFSRDKVKFLISGFGGLASAQVGEGTYELTENYLFIHTTDFPGEKSSFEISDSARKDTCTVYMISQQNFAIQGILVESRAKSGKLVSGKVTGNDGKVFFSPCDKISSIKASSLGYNSISLDYTPGKNYRITLAEHDVIENKTVVFRIQTIDDETISVLMLSDDFKEVKDREKELQKLEKRAQKKNKLDKRLTKVYVPYVRRY